MAWPTDETAAIGVQRALSLRRVVTPLGPIRAIAGADVAYDKESDALYAAVVVLDARTFEVVEIARHTGRATFPYTPGCLSFRELPPLIQCFAKLDVAPDLVICDGNGVMHPRRFGLASHLGVIFDIPTVGCAKNRLLGEHDAPADKRGSRAPVRVEREVIGACLRTQDGVKPVYVSIGHRVTLDDAVDQVLRAAERYRLPETTRCADQEVNRMRRESR